MKTKTQNRTKPTTTKRPRRAAKTAETLIARAQKESTIYFLMEYTYPNGIEKCQIIQATNVQHAELLGKAWCKANYYRFGKVHAPIS